VNSRLLVLLLLLATISLAAWTSLSPAGDFIRLPDGRHLYLNCIGSGSPTVILEGGFAASSRVWFKVQPTIAQHTRVCSYDRAGYGKSDVGPFPRDGMAVAADLNHALARANVRGPLILVGHSIGALYMRIFSDLRPKDVVGMVLVDPSVEYQGQRFASQFGPGAGSTAPLLERSQSCLAVAQAGALPSPDPSLKACTSGLSANVWRTQISELDTMWGSTSDAVARGRRSYGTMPLIVLTADRTYGTGPTATIVEAFWSKLHREIAQRSTIGREETVANSSHMMMLDRPDAINDAVLQLVAATRKPH